MSFQDTLQRSVICITAPARALVKAPEFDCIDARKLDQAETHLQSLGWQIQETENVRCVFQRFAGTDRERMQSVMKALRSEQADLALALRGGYGTTRILPLLDWKKLEEFSIPIVGLSDITSLELALLARLGRSSWQGPTLSFFAQPNDFRDRCFAAAMTQELWQLPFRALRAPKQFQATGTLWGGNLSILTSLIGTPWMPLITGGILFIEDIAEPAWRIERMLDQLANCGILARQKTILCGEFTGADRAEGKGCGQFSLSDALDWIEQKIGIPIITGLPFGHIASTATIPCGVQGTVQINAGQGKIFSSQPPLPSCAPGLLQPHAGLWWQ